VSGPSIADTDFWREKLVALGFSDDGERLRGPVSWEDPASGVATARVEITPGERFPFAPPRVVILDAGAPLEITFHIDRDDSLCLWENDWAVDEAPWRDPRALLRRIGGWLENTASGWPGDDVCDLERYLEQDQDNLVLYDATALLPGRAVRTAAGPTPAAIVVTGEQRRVDDILRDPRARRRKDKRLAWIADIGAVERPLRAWTDVAAALGARVGEVRRLIGFGVVDLLLLRYCRGRAGSVLALTVRGSSAGIQVTACESADLSAVTRSMRAGPAAAELAEVKVAIVGCGAIGSFTADLLFRAGVRQLTLRDGERLRPGNVVRHLGGAEQVGQAKTHAVRDCLARVDTNVHGVKGQAQPLLRLDDAIALVRDHDVVLDATGNARASSLLTTAAWAVGPGLGHVVVAACVQRDGDVLRVDRLPLRGKERYLPALPLLDDAAHPREQGCGGPVSPAPPGAVIAAAELAHRVVIDEATRACTLPATIAEVRRAQPEPPYDQVGRVTSDETATGSVT
jgi:molybdopterin/thiamine biosynthesis adenylyltransferase